MKNKPLCLVGDAGMQRLQRGDMFVRYHHSPDFRRAFRMLGEMDEMECVYLYSDDLESMWQDFSAEYHMVQAAGGLVQTTGEAGTELLFIKRLGLWDLPKGKVEEGEEPDKAAIREVEEETGIVVDKIEAFVDHTFHVYNRSGVDYLKKTNWYSMRARSREEGTPQAGEGITGVKWVPPQEIGFYMDNTYGSLRNLLEKQFSTLGKED